MPFVDRLVAEQVAEDRDLPQARNPIFVDFVVDLVDAADDGRAAIAHQQLGLGVPGQDRRVVAAGDGAGLEGLLKDKK